MVAYQTSNNISGNCAATPAQGRKAEKGFTLIELSIVLVIIGLIVGGVLVGQDLIRAAEVRATISQIEKYNTAVNTFRGKFNAMPGDMNLATATTFGFITANRGAAAQGDGNGILEGGTTAAVANMNLGGEIAMFWVDLSGTAGGNLIDGGFTAGSALINSNTGLSTGANTLISGFLPAAKLGRGNFITVFQNGGQNFYEMENLSASNAVAAGVLAATASLSVVQAYNIDKKMDDGLPTSGNVMATLINGSTAVIASPTAGYPGNSAVVNSTDITANTAGTSCYYTTILGYALDKNNGAGANCALAFRFQ